MTEVQQFIYILIGNYIQICLLFLQPFYLLTYKGKHRVAAYWISTTVSFGIFMLNTNLFSQDGCIRILKPFFNFSWFLIFVMLFFRDSRKRRLVTGAVGIILVQSSEFLSLIFLHSMGLLNFHKGSEYSEGALRGIIFINIISFILDIYFILFWKRVVEKCRVQGMGLYLTMPIYQFILLFMFFNQARHFDIRVAVLGLSMLVMGITINVLMMYFLQKMEQKLEVEERLSKLYRQRQYEWEYYQVTNRHVEQLREVRHDFVNMIQTVYLLIQDKDTTKQAVELLSQAYRDIQQTKLVRYCENTVVNALISIKAQRAKENGIEFSAVCSLGDISGMEEIDLCSLFGNLLDNAMEACMPSTDEKPGKMELRAVEKGGYQVVRTCNTYFQRKEKGNFFQSSKEDQLNHGYGLKLIERICCKYGGELKTKVTENEVYITAYLALEYTRGKQE